MEKLPSYLNESEVARFITAIDEFPFSDKTIYRNKLILKMILYTGIRVSEALNLKQKDISQKDEYFILQVRGKGNKPRIVMIFKRHIESLLDSWLSQKRAMNLKSDLVFCNFKDKILTQAYVSRVVEQVLSYAGIRKEKNGAHLLRHSFATLLYQKSLDLILVQEALGHSSIATSRIYTHFDTSRLQKTTSIMPNGEWNKWDKIYAKIALKSIKKTAMLINAVIEKDENGYFAFVPELKGCVSEGSSFEEARANIKEAIELYLESLGADEIWYIVAKEAMITPIEVALGR